MESINLELTDKQKQAIEYIAKETSRDLNTVLSLVISEGIIFRFGSVSDYRVLNADNIADEIKKESDYRLGNIKDEILKEDTVYCLVNGTNKKSIVKGFTTNPSLMRKAGAKSYEKYSKILLKICKKKPISLEVFADNYSEMKSQALKINSWGNNLFVKIPVTNSKKVFMGQLIKELNKKKHSK